MNDAQFWMIIAAGFLLALWQPVRRSLEERARRRRRSVMREKAARYHALLVAMREREWRPDRITAEKDATNKGSDHG